MLNIRAAREQDHDAIWRIFQAVVAPGDTYAFEPDISRSEALAAWFDADTETFVAESDARGIVGTYILRPNHAGPGSHVANAAFMVAPDARRLGIGRAMAEHCLARARERGFRAMQFNFVVSSNAAAMKLWQQLGFRIVGTLPGAFRHPRLGFVDAHVMFRELTETQL